MKDEQLIGIMREVAEKHGVELFAMFATTRARAITDARAEFYFRALKESTHSSVEIGRVCARDHSTVLKGAEQYARDNGLPVPRTSTLAEDTARRKMMYGVSYDHPWGSK